MTDHAAEAARLLAAAEDTGPSPAAQQLMVEKARVHALLALREQREAGVANAIDGPNRVYVAAIPGGATLGLGSFVHSLLVSVATDAELLDLFSDVVDDLNDPGQPHDPHAAESLRLEELTERLDPRVFVYGPHVARLADSLHTIARPKGLPSQPNRRAS